MPRAFLKAREPFSSYSHFIGAVLSGAGLFVLLVRLLSTPLRWFWKLCINTLCGAVLLGLVNLLAPLCTISPAAAKPSCGG